jgi:hypothetical protein
MAIVRSNRPHTTGRQLDDLEAIDPAYPVGDGQFSRGCETWRAERAGGRPSIRAAIEACLLVSAFATALLMSAAYGRTIAGIAPIAAALLIAALSLVYGRALGQLLRIPPEASYHSAFELVVGFSVVSLVHLTATAALNLTALVTLPIDLVCGAALLTVTVAQRRSVATQPAERGRASIAFDVCVILVCGALVALWTRETALSIQEAERTGLFRAWQDFFLHASEITYLRDYPAFHQHAQYLAGAPQPLYHRASYAMSALFSLVARMPSLETATTFWMPTGLLLCALAIYAYGCALGGRLAGLAAVTAVFLFPDASTYGFKNSFLGFSWLMQVAPGSGYAIALTFMALIVIAAADWLRDQWRFTAAAALVGASAAFRMHVAVLAGGMVVLLACFTLRPVLTRRRIAMVFAAILAAGGTVVLLESVALAPHFLTGQSHPLLFLQLVHGMADVPTTYAAWTNGRSHAMTFVIGYAMLLVSACGLTIPALVVVWLGNMLGKVGHRVLLFPIALVLAHMVIILIVPTAAYGDLSDFGHRPFVLIYAVAAASAGAAGGRLLAGWSNRTYGGETPGLLVLAGMMIAGSVVPLRMGPRLQQRWGSPFSLIPIQVEAFEAGRFVRRHSTPGEYVLSADNDPLAVFVALTERTAYLSRHGLYQLIGGATGALATERAAAHTALAPVTFEQIQSFGRSRGVRWYVANTPASQLWPAAVTSRCAYCGRGIQVYDLR